MSTRPPFNRTLQHEERFSSLLVGASFSGFNVRVFAGKYPNEVAGAVWWIQRTNTRTFTLRARRCRLSTGCQAGFEICFVEPHQLRRVLGLYGFCCTDPMQGERHPRVSPLNRRQHSMDSACRQSPSSLAQALEPTVIYGRECISGACCEESWESSADSAHGWEAVCCW